MSRDPVDRVLDANGWDELMNSVHNIAPTTAPVIMGDPVFGQQLPSTSSIHDPNDETDFTPASGDGT